MSNQLSTQGQFATTNGNLGINLNLTVTTPVGAVTVVALASGANTITVPAGTTIVIIQFPVGNAVAVTLKGVAGDTGTALNKAGTNMLQWDSSVTTFVITTGGAIAALTTITFI